MQEFQRYFLLLYRLSFAFRSLFWCFTSGCDKERRPVAEFMREFIVFCSTCTIWSLKSSRLLSPLLMSFLYCISEILHEIW